MLKHKIFTFTILAIILSAFLFTLSGCKQSQTTQAQDNSSIKETVDQIISGEDDLKDHVLFGKKYYYLGYDGYTQNEYYTINDDGSATYTHVMKTDDKITFYQVINFKWTYSRNGDCVLVHNGTKMIKGEQDEAFGVSRVMYLAGDIIYWSASGENTYYICEDYLSQIPNYAKLIV